MAFSRLMPILLLMMMGGPGGVGQDERLEGDEVKMIVFAANGILVCAVHHDDWTGVVLEGEHASDRSSQQSMYRDYPLQPLPEGLPE